MACDAEIPKRRHHQPTAYSGRRARSSWTAWVWFIGMTVVATSVLFYRLDALPIEPWDESRIAVSAFEMAKSGLSLITTYEGIPDHWNTKPPLLIWLMSISIRVFGPNEWGVRLPSALAALATVSIVFAFCNFRLKRSFVGFTASLILLHSNGYIQFHAARSGDYDAILTLWTTGYLLAGYMYVHDSPSRRRRWLLLCTVGIVLAFLTKSVQGLIFLPALLIYAVRYIPIIEILRSPAAYVSGATVLLSFAGYYFTREQIDPGYFAAAMANDPGRFVTVLDYHVLGPLYYIQSFPLIFLSLLFAGFQLCRARGERRQISIYLGVMSLFYLLIISLSATQLPWYAVPLLPLNAMIIAVAIDEPFEWMIMRWRWFRLMTNRALVPVCVLAGLGVIAQNVHRLTLREERVIDDERNLTNVFLRSHPVHYAILQKFVVIQQSYRSEEFFVAPTLFYVNGLRSAGHSIEILPPSTAIPAGFNTAVMCGAEVRNAMAAEVLLEAIVVDGQCGIYRIAGHR